MADLKDVFVCPNCNTQTTDHKDGQIWSSDRYTRTFYCHLCQDFIILLVNAKQTSKTKFGSGSKSYLNALQSDTAARHFLIKSIDQFYPKTYSFPEVAPEVPDPIKQIYNEANMVRGISLRGSAILFRLAVESTLKNVFNPSANMLSQIINEIKDKIEPNVVIDSNILRKIGNAGAHDADVQIEDADIEYCLRFIDDLFYYYYVLPRQRDERKKRYHLQ